MPDTRYEPTLPPVSAAATRVLLIGEPSPLRSAVAQQLRTNTALLACLDAKSELPPALLSAAIGGETELAGATVVFVTVPRPPGLATRLRHRFQFPALAAAFSRAVTTARRHGAARVIVLSTAFRYDHDDGAAPAPRFTDPGGRRDLPCSRRRTSGAPVHQPRRRLGRTAARLDLQPRGSHHPPGAGRRPARLAAHRRRPRRLGRHDRRARRRAGRPAGASLSPRASTTSPTASRSPRACSTPAWRRPWDGPCIALTTSAGTTTASCSGPPAGSPTARSVTSPDGSRRLPRPPRAWPACSSSP